MASSPIATPTITGSTPDPHSPTHQAIPSSASTMPAPTRLHPDDEKEERHQAVADPVLEVLRDAGVADADAEHRSPHPVIRPGVDIDPDESRDRGREQDRRASRLRPEKLPQGRLEIARPCC